MSAENGHDANPPASPIVKFKDIKPRLGGRPLIKGLLEQEQLSLFFGETGSGKTFAALDMSCHIAAGKDWFGHKLDQGTTVYIAAEAGRSLFNRVAAIRSEKNFGDIPFYAVTCPVDLCRGVENGSHHALTNLIESVIPQDDGVRMRHITIDTVSRALAGGNENAPDDMGAFVGALDYLRDRYRCHVTSIHHTGKDADRGARGHSLLKANLDTEVEFSGTDGIRTATITKQRDGEIGETISFKLRQILLGHNDDGDPVHSCIVAAAQAEALRAAAQHIKLTSVQIIALKALEQALAMEGTHTIDGGNGILGLHVAVKEETWRTNFMLSTSKDGKTEDARRKAWRRARDDLIAKEVAKMYDGLVCLNGNLGHVP
jgi:hypothetical protein